ncbi:hypothetical protein P8C59_006510 [Phyllachora maydis]|uniref:Uncharacterized protein n=1 Tax=Phyllachora maydis TaxID=1825666 RepID=A0AAD9MFK9_9PEZI|nr:hypothetical protein P8C59_006510 [Phyllachora maydis]
MIYTSSSSSNNSSSSSSNNNSSSISSTSSNNPLGAINKAPKRSGYSFLTYLTTATATTTTTTSAANPTTTITATRSSNISFNSPFKGLSSIAVKGLIVYNRVIEEGLLEEAKKQYPIAGYRAKKPLPALGHPAATTAAKLTIPAQRPAPT